jgi:hypothetical protein
MNTVKTLYIVIWRFYLFAFRWVISKNKIRAKPGQTVCIRYNSYRHKGKLVKVVETGYCEYDYRGKHYRDRDIDCVKLKFKDGTVAWNFTPNEYHIFNAK